MGGDIDDALLKSPSNFILVHSGLYSFYMFFVCLFLGLFPFSFCIILKDLPIQQGFISSGHFLLLRVFGTSMVEEYDEIADSQYPSERVEYLDEDYGMIFLFYIYILDFIMRKQALLCFHILTLATVRSLANVLKVFS